MIGSFCEFADFVHEFQRRREIVKFASRPDLIVREFPSIKRC
jgi:hypothetical protein